MIRSDKQHLFPERERRVEEEEGEEGGGREERRGREGWRDREKQLRNL